MKTTFGINAVGKPTPLWAKWVFRVTFIITTAASFWVGATELLPAFVKTELLVGLKSLDMVVFGLSKLFGVEPENN